MNRFRIALLLLLTALLLLTVSAWAEEAEDLTAGCTVKVVDKTGKVKSITDGKYTTFWESSKRKEPWVTISSDKPIYGLYLCFRNLPESYVIQKKDGDEWVTVAEGDPLYYHAYYELDGLKKIRILSTAEKKNILGFNEIYAFGKGEAPEWVQRWEPPAEKADLLFLIAHPDDELLFTGGAIPTYAAERGKKVEVAYLSYSNTTRRSEALNGLWAMGVRNYPEFGPFSDRYAKTGKVKDAYKEAGGKQKVLDWVNELFRRYKPEVVVTQAENGEYGHPQHKMIADAAAECFTLAADEQQSPESAQAYGAWQVKKLYLHLYGEEADQTVLDWDQPLSAFGGRTGAELAAEAFALHVSQKGMGAGKGAKFKEFKVETTGAVDYPYNRFGLRNSTVGPDEAKNDFLEHIGQAELAETEEPTEEHAEEPAKDTAGEQAEGTAVEPSEADETLTGEEAAGEAAEDTAQETEEEEKAESEEETEEEIPESAESEEPAAETAGTRDEAGSVSFRDTKAPEWADVELNERGFTDEGEYIFADDENGRYMYAGKTMRVQIVRTLEEPDPKHPFYCFTAHIWCDVGAGELPVTVYNDPEKPKSGKEFMRNIALNNKVVFATTTDYYIYRIKADYPTGIEVRNGEVIFDDPHSLQYKWGSMPTYETLALYSDGHAESLPNKEKSAPEYVEEGATQVFSFGPCLVKDGQLTQYSLELTNNSYNPRLAIGVVENGHYVVVMCEGRIKRSKGTKMAYLAELMMREGCTLAVNMDGGQSAAVAFMGHQLNQVWSSQPNGREQADILAFGFSDQVGSFEMLDEFKSKKK